MGSNESNSGQKNQINQLNKINQSIKISQINLIKPIDNDKFPKIVVGIDLELQVLDMLIVYAIIKKI